MVPLRFISTNLQDLLDKHCLIIKSRIFLIFDQYLLLLDLFKYEQQHTKTLFYETENNIFRFLEST